MKLGLTTCLTGLADFVKRLIKDESGVGVIELVLILVVLMGLVIIFKSSINDLLNNIFSSITSLSEEIL